MQSHNILVIGNGFDLAHGLPTSYQDFLSFLSELKYYKTNSNEKIREQHFNSIVKDSINVNLYNYIANIYSKNSLPEYINKEYGSFEENLWYIYFDEQKSSMKDGWIDFEIEISRVIQLLDDVIKIYSKTKNTSKAAEYTETLIKIRELKKCNEVLEIRKKGSTNEFLKLKEQLEQDLDNFIRYFEIYLEDCINRVPLTTYSLDIVNIPQPYILSFNYTNTYERKYAPMFPEWSPDYNYIHGKADITNTINTNNMVLGIDEYLDDNTKNSDVQFIKFKKYYQRIFKQTGSLYKEWLEELTIENKDINVYFYGHSLDVSDKDILQELIMTPKVTTTIFYHDKNAYSQQIINLVKVIGGDELIKRVYGKNRTIIFKKQSNLVT